MGMSSGFSSASAATNPSVIDAAAKAADIAQQDQLIAQTQQTLTPIKKDQATRLYGRGNTTAPIPPSIGRTTLGV